MGILKIPRITTTQRLTITPEEGELLYDTTNDKIYKGDNSTVGGVEVGAGGLKYDETTGTGAAYISDLSITGYTIGDAYLIEFHTNNTVVAPTIAIGGFSGITIVKNANDPLEVGDIVAGRIYLIAYDGANFQLTTIGGGGSTQNFTSTVKHEVKAGVALTKGQAVYVSSADGTNMIVSKADYSQESTSAKTMGLIAQNLAVNEFGYVVTEGLLDGLDTSAAGAAGDPVWLGDDGNLIYGIANKPYAPNHMVAIGIVTRKNPNNGEIFVKIQNGFELEELHNVDLKTTAPTNGDVLAFNGNLWVDVASTSLNINANNLTTGTVPLARLGTNQPPAANTFLSSNNTWASVVSSGTIASGTARRLALYTTAGTGTALGDSFTQSSPNTVNVTLASTAITASRTITIPVNDTANVEFVMNAGAQTIAGLKTFSTFTSYGNSQTQAAPNLTSRSAGSRVLIHEAFTANTQTDYAIGTESNIMWRSIPQATSTFSHRWYGGVTELMSLRGDGLLTLAGQEIINSTTTLNYLPANLSTASPSISNYPLQVRATYGTTNYAYSNIVPITVTTSYTSITASVAGVTITGTGMSTFAQGTGITLSNVTGVTGLTANTTNYFVITSSATSITLAATLIDALNSVPLKTASGTAGTGTATANYVEVQGIGATGPAFTALTTGTLIALSNVTGITAGIASGTNYVSVLSGASTLRIATTIGNAGLGTVLSSLTGTYNTLVYTGITTGSEVVVSGTSLPALTTGTAVYLSSTAGITGLNTTTIYYVYASVAGTSLKLASTSTNANNGTAISTATGTQTAGGNLRGVLSVGWGPTRGSGMTFWSGSNNPNGTFTGIITGSVDSQIGILSNTASRFDYELVFKTGDSNTNLTEKFRIHSPSDARGISISGTVGSYTGNLTFRSPININTPDNPATNPQLTISPSNGYGWIRYSGTTTEFPRVYGGTVLRSTGDRIVFSESGITNFFPNGINYTTDGTSPANGQTFWGSGAGTSINLASTGGVNIFFNPYGSTAFNVGYGSNVSAPYISFTTASGGGAAMILRMPRTYNPADSKIIQAAPDFNSNANILFLRVNNITNLVGNQVASITNITPSTSAYNGIVSRLLTVNGTTTYGNYTSTAGQQFADGSGNLFSIPLLTAANGVDVTLSGWYAQILPVMTTGTAVKLSSTATTGLNVNDTFYVYNPVLTGNRSYKLAASYANAIAGIPITNANTLSIGVGVYMFLPGISANSTDGIIVYGAGLTSSTSFIANGTPVTLSTIGALTWPGFSSSTLYYIYGATGSSFRLAASFADATATTPVPITSASGNMVVGGGTGTVTSNSVSLYATSSGTWTSGGNLSYVVANTGYGTSALGIYFDKDDALNVSSTVGFHNNIPVLTYTRSSPTDGIFRLFSDTSITQQVLIGNNSNNIIIGGTPGDSTNSSITIGQSQTGTMSPTASRTKTINIGIAGDFTWNNANGYYTTTNINIGNNYANNSSYFATQSFTNINGKLRLIQGYYGRILLDSTSTTAGWGFEAQSRDYLDITTTTNSTIATRVAHSFAAPSFSFLATTPPVTISNAINLYVAGIATPAYLVQFTDAWGIWSDGRVRIAATGTAAISTNTTSGALVVSGGVGIGGALFGTTINGTIITGSTSLIAPTHAGATTTASNLTLRANTADTTTGQVNITTTTASTSSTTGALAVSGGVGIAGALYVGGAVGITGNVGFYNVGPQARASAYNQTGYSFVTKTHSASTYVAPSGGTTIDTQARTSLGQLAADVTVVKNLINSVIDDLQAYGLFQ